MKKNHITASLCLAVSIAVMLAAGRNFVDARYIPMPKEGPGVTEVRMLSDWFDGLKGTNGDTPVYVLKGEQEGGKMLVLGGTHPNEPASNVSATVFIENAIPEQGTIYVVPCTNHSAMTNNDPGEGNLQYFTIPTPNGDRQFRFGSRASNPIDQWPDPDVYIHYPSGQRLSGSETRNINRTYPGRPDGNMTEKMSYGITQLIKTEGIDLTFDLHESSPEYPVINATVSHEKCMDIASMGCMELMMDGMDMALEISPTNLHGLTHRELGDFTDTFPLLMETANASQGRLRGATTPEQILMGEDECYVRSAKMGLLAVPYDRNYHPIEERCGRHLQGILEYSSAYNELHPGEPVTYSGVPSYEELFLNAAPDQLGGAWLGQFLM